MSLSGDTTMMMPVAPTGMGGFGGMGGGFGWGNDWWILILFLLWGNNGWGNNGSMNGGVGAEVQRGFDHSATVTKLDGITQGICDSTYALNNTITNGFHGVDSAICNLGYQTQSGFNALSTQLAQCCCETQRSIDGVRYDMATQACETRHAIQESTRQVLDAMNQNYVRGLESKVNDLTMGAYISELKAYNRATAEANTAEILRRSGHDCPSAAYIVQPPTPVTFNNCGTGYAGYGYAGCNPCGCAA